MEKLPLQTAPKNESQAQTPFDFSEYNQPEAPQGPVEVPADGVFDFSEYQNGQNQPKTFEEVSREISADALLTKRWDFSDENIASGGPILRDATPTEIYEQGRIDQEAEQGRRKKKFGSGVVSKLFRRR